MNIEKSGFVAIVGRPNVGKSTLLNRLIGKKISITSAKPQTTRWQILGIKTTEHAQIIYIDTPGLHEGEKKAMNRYMNRVARAVIFDADIIVFLIDANYWHKADEEVLQQLKEANRPIILALNKVDLVKDKSEILPLIDEIKEKLNFREIIPISALKGSNLDQLEKAIVALLPEGPALYEEKQITDKTPRFQIAEIIREKLIQNTEQELPYATTITIDEFKETEKLINISAIIWVERQGQKVIVIGAGGAKLKKIGSDSRHEIEKLLGQKVFLRLWVKVKADWADNEKALKSLGYE